MNFIFVLVISFFVSITSSSGTVEIIDLKDKHFVLTKVDNSFLYDKQNFLYHTFDLNQLHNQMLTITKPTIRDRVAMKKAMKYFEQLGFKKIHKRSINILGSGIKWITGNPDHDDLVRLQESINHLIDNNNAFTENHGKMMELLKNVGSENINSQILSMLVEELENVILTINMAKNKQINTLALNLKEIEAMIEVENSQLPIINILEYSDVHICKINNTIVLIIKYPVINRQCEHFKITPLEFRHGKIEMDKQVSKCNGNFQGTSRCMEVLNTNICQSKDQDNCTMRILQNQNDAQCDVKQEENEKIQFINSGHIIVSGEHQINNISVTGINLINFNDNVHIDSIAYFNFEKKAKEYIITHRNEKFEILQLIETSKENLKFRNVKALRKFMLPLETHPIRTTFGILLIIVLIILFTWLLGKCCTIYKTYHETKSKKKYQRALICEYEKRGLPLTML